MFIKRTRKRVGRKTYVNHILVESVVTPKGPRHKVVCSLGAPAPAPAEQWRTLAQRIEAALSGQQELARDPTLEAVVGKVRSKQRVAKTARGESDLVSIHTDRVTTEEPREAGPIHVGHQMWMKLGVSDVLARAGLSPKARLLTEVMTQNEGSSSVSWPSP